MNVFDELVSELKEEHLIEDVSVEDAIEPTKTKQIDVEMLDLPNIEAATALESAQFSEESAAQSNDEVLEAQKFLDEMDVTGRLKASENDIGLNEIDQSLYSEVKQPVTLQPNPATQVHNVPINLQPKQKLSGFELFRKRVMQEVSSLQMADNIFSSVEREQLKTITKPYDDIKVKQVLHSFVQLKGEISPAQHAQAEFELRQEIETWYSALAVRDEKISVHNLRYCCENTRPPLSPPALLALARFYRNAQFSDSVRNKFDLIITRLFSRDVKDNRRELAFSREELISHLTELYEEWESIPFYSTNDSDLEILQTVLRFEDLIAEAKRARKFEQLIESDFFNRVRALKRTTEESCFAPKIATIAIICNVEVGNRYLDLLALEQENSSNESIEEKYGFFHDQSVSEATNKSFQITNLLSEQKTKVNLIDLGIIDPNKISLKKRTVTAIFPFLNLGFLNGVNRTILVMTILTVALTAGLVLWVEVFNAATPQSESVKTLKIENTPFKNYVESTRIHNETLFVITTAVFDGLTREKKEEIVTKLFVEGSTKGYKKVHLLDQKSMTIGSAVKDRVEIK